MKIHSVSGTVCHHECDAAGNLKLHNLLDYFQDAAAQHADILHFGMDDMADAGLIWVLARIKLQVLRQPALNDKFTVTTYPSGLERLFARRQYVLTINGETAVRASSQWLMINKKNGRPVNPQKAAAFDLPDNSDLEVFFPGIDKLAAVEGKPCSSGLVGMGDVDLNRHLNNAVYGRWIIDALGRSSDMPVVPRIKDIQINFLMAGLPGNEALLQGVWNSDGTFYISGTWQNGDAAFQAAGTAGKSDF